ncbi:exosortase family protein XrtG [Leuconostoc litchii]|uniref:Exosortase family protein XrtG n=1 Tax=Leuconostoc litchii TaxID=1981069 RepID=A0A6P2CM45_9LACO|nr:exosortase family protein XrtG [Leuconostoc litchii]TYC47085.1 exosortase family protein XrtG [Leuconostoc litchii]GMA69025.1 exosortase family protein XrtG [Leuconostoc litchii]
MNIFLLIGVLIWLYTLSVFKRAKLPAFYFIVGSIGLFFILFFMSKPYFIWIMVRAVSIGLSIIVQPFNLASISSDYGLIAITHGFNSMTMSIDYECSGVIETAAFWGLLTFYPMYKSKGKVALALYGLVWIYTANIIRLTLIVLIVHNFGTEYFFLAHSIIGRIVFYILVVLFYYRVFTYTYLSKNKEEV